jgi:prephenate dehydrogenase
MKSILIIGTGLIGSSVGLALRQAGFTGTITGIDASGDELKTAETSGAIDRAARSPQEHRDAIAAADVILLAVPVLAILQWMQTLAPQLKPGQLVTDAGSTKAEIVRAAMKLMPDNFLPGHPMAGKESGGAALAEAALYQGATWIFTPLHESTPIEVEWRSWVQKFGAKLIDMDAEKHDEICAWVSHMPQMVSTAMSAMLEDRFGDSPELRAIGGRALREMTRLGSSPFSMWRDIAHTNEANIAETLLTLEQRLQHVRENLKTPELREEFARANAFRKQL